MEIKDCEVCRRVDEAAHADRAALGPIFSAVFLATVRSVPSVVGGLRRGVVGSVRVDVYSILQLESFLLVRAIQIQSWMTYRPIMVAAYRTPRERLQGSRTLES